MQVRRLLARKASSFIVLLLVISLLTACLGGGDEGITTDPLAGNGQAEGATLTCSEACANRGQCGESQERGTVVLLNVEGPAVAAMEHDLAVPAATVVNIVDVRSMNVVENASGFEFPVNFYRVFIPDRNMEAWVAAWCLLNTQP